MRIFISQLMRGKSDEEILLEREEAAKKIERKYPDTDIEVIDSFFQVSNMTPLECLGESLKLLSQADLAVFTREWFNDRGCRIEHEAAISYGIPLEFL